MNIRNYKMIPVIFALSLSLALVNFAQPQNGSTAKDEKSKLADQTYEKAQKLSRQGEIESLQTSLLKFNEALKLFRELGNKKYAAYCLAGIGYVNSLFGERQKALNFYAQAIKLSRAVKDDTGIAETLSSTGLIYRKLDENEKALRYFQNALPIAQKLRNKELQAKILTNIGVTYFNLVRNKEALDYYEKALRLRKSDSRGEANTLNYLALVYIRIGEKEKALASFERALSIRTAIDDKRGIAETLQGLGWFYVTFGDTQKALEYLNPALALAKNIGDKNRQAIISDRLQLIWTSKGNLQAAIFYGKQSVNLYQDLRKAINDLDETTQKAYLKSVESAYRKLVNNLISQGRFVEAQSVLNLLKEEEFSGLVRRSDEKSNSIPYSKAEGFTLKILDQLATIGREKSELVEKIEKSSLTETERLRFKDLQKQIEITEAEFNKSLAALSAETNKTDNFEVVVKDAQAFMSTLKELGRGTVALYTVIVNDAKPSVNPNSPQKEQIKTGWIILVTPEFRKAYPVDVKDLEKTIFNFRQTLTSPSYNSQPFAQELYKKMFLQAGKDNKTLAADLDEYFKDKPNKTLMWSLDGIFRYVPIAALHDGKSYLVEKYRNTIFNTASKDRLKDAVKPNWTALGLGVSIGRTESGKTFSSLVGAKRELQKIVKQDNNSGIMKGSIKMDEQFTR